LQNLRIEILNGLDDLGTRPGIGLIKKDLGAWRKRDTFICSCCDARNWRKGFVPTSTIGTGGFEKREVIKFVIVIMIRVVGSPTTSAACGA
jgi:hypothetical protein